MTDFSILLKNNCTVLDTVNNKFHNKSFMIIIFINI